MSQPLQLTKLRLRNLLSFGPESDWFELKPLNVLIGPNASGKSNVIDALSILRSLPGDLPETIRDGGGIHEWIWKGPGETERRAQIYAQFAQRKGPALNYSLWLAPSGPRFKITHERLEDVKGHIFFERLDSAGTLVAGRGQSARTSHVKLTDDRSVLDQRVDADLHPEIASLRSACEGILVYRDWHTGRRSVLRLPQPADLPDDFLEPSGRNISMVINALQRYPKTWDELYEAMCRFHPRFKELKIIAQGNTLQIYLRETDLEGLVPATRLSDGTLRYLALLSVLLHPAPPPIVCIEEPELGLHPDLIDDVAKLLVSASFRVQLVVTTHSDHLINALSGMPDVVLVTEREEGTTLRRPEPERLRTWLQTHGLGDLWVQGDIGGTRW